MLQNTIINHVSLVVDKSGSMQMHSAKVIEVFDRELNGLKQKSIDLNQETRISIYLFNDQIEVLAFDMDVMRFSSLKSFYRSLGQTALIDAAMRSIIDHQKLPELYGDHAFLQYIITDGQENYSKIYSSSNLQDQLSQLKDNWTAAILVPDAQGELFARRVGFNAGAIWKWDTSHTDALEGVGKQFTSVMDNYMSMRKSGVRGTRNLFDLSLTNLTSVKNVGLKKLPDDAYEIIPVRKDGVEIREYVEEYTKRPYRIGSCYYMPTKPVVIQDHKNIFLQKIKDGNVYEGDTRNLLGLPDYEVKVKPGDHKGWRIFVQSTSVNRHLVKDTFVLVMK